MRSRQELRQSKRELRFERKQIKTEKKFRRKEQSVQRKIARKSKPGLLALKPAKYTAGRMKASAWQKAVNEDQDNDFVHAMRNSNLDKLRADLAEAKRIVSQPFPQQDELTEKLSWLKILTEVLTQDAIEAKNNAPKKQPTCYFSRAEHRKNLMKNIANAVPAKDKQKDKPKDKTAI